MPQRFGVPRLRRDAVVGSMAAVVLLAASGVALVRDTRPTPSAPQEPPSLIADGPDEDATGPSSLPEMRTSLSPLPSPRVSLPDTPPVRVRVRGNGHSRQPTISADGDLVTFVSEASNLVLDDTNGVADVFLRDRSAGTTRRLSVARDGTQANGPSAEAVISAAGTHVVFTSKATNLTEPPAPARWNVYLLELASGAIRMVSSAIDGDADGDSGSEDRLMRGVAVSRRGERVAFVSQATNLVPGDTNGDPDVFVRDVGSGVTTRVSVSSTGVQAAGASLSIAISADGSVVAYSSEANNLVVGDTNPERDVFVHDIAAGTTELVSVESDGTHPAGHAFSPGLSGNGNLVSFASSQPLAGQSNSGFAFLRDRAAGTTTRLSLMESEQMGINSTALAPGGAFGAFASSSLSFVQGRRLSEQTMPPEVGTETVYSIGVSDGGVVVFGAEGVVSPDREQDPDTISDIFAQDLTTGDVTLVSLPTMT